MTFGEGKILTALFVSPVMFPGKLLSSAQSDEMWSKVALLLADNGNN